MKNRIIGIALVVLVLAGAIGYTQRAKRDQMATSSASDASFGGTVAMEAGGRDAKTYAPSGRAYNMAADEVRTQPVTTPSAQPSASQERLVIKTGQISMVVKDVREAISKISAYAVSKGGYVVGSNLSQEGIIPSGAITFRIPVAVYDSGMGDVKAFGEVKSESSTGDDVTEQYVDLDSRVRNLRATETQLLEIMKRAVKISDVLEVQQQLTQVRSEIESIQGRMKYLADSAAMSSVTVYLSTDPGELPVVAQPSDKWKPMAELKNALRSLVDIAKSLSYGLIWLLVYIPVIVIIGLMLWAMVKFARRQYQKWSGR